MTNTLNPHSRSHQFCLIFFIIALFIASPFVQAKLFSNFTYIGELHAVNLIGIIGSIFIVTAFANIVYRVYYAIQKGYVANILPAAGTALSMICIALANKY